MQTQYQIPPRSTAKQLRSSLAQIGAQLVTVFIPTAFYTKLMFNFFIVSVMEMFM